MKIGTLVRCTTDTSLVGVVVGLGHDGDHTQIFWADPDEDCGWIVSTWHNDDFEVFVNHKVVGILVEPERQLATKRVEEAVPWDANDPRCW